MQAVVAIVDTRCHYYYFDKHLVVLYLGLLYILLGLLLCLLLYSLLDLLLCLLLDLFLLNHLYHHHDDTVIKDYSHNIGSELKRKPLQHSNLVVSFAASFRNYFVATNAGCPLRDPQNLDCDDGCPLCLSLCESDEFVIDLVNFGTVDIHHLSCFVGNDDLFHDLHPYCCCHGCSLRNPYYCCHSCSRRHGTLFHLNYSLFY
jgi:hypothetical protein